MIVAKHIVVTVAAAGTAVKVISASNLVVGSVSFLPLSVTTAVYIGASTVSSTSYGLKMLAAATVPVVMNLGDGVLDLATVYIDGGTNGDKVAVLYFEKVSR